MHTANGTTESKRTKCMDVGTMHEPNIVQQRPTQRSLKLKIITEENLFLNEKKLQKYF